MAPVHECIHELFDRQAARRPDTVALVEGDEQLTYRELAERANQLAHYLRAQGVRGEEVVGVYLERSLDFVVALLGILKAGGAYLACDAASPPDRLAGMLTDASVRFVLTKAPLAEQLPVPADQLLCLDAAGAELARQPRDPLAAGARPNHLAYVIYTSGSTGMPKGTRVEHRNVPGFFSDVKYARFDAEQVFLHYSSVSWDALTLELWPALLTGARCVIFPGASPTPEELTRLIDEQRVTVLWLTAAFFNVLMDTMPHRLAGVTQLLVGGEALSVPHVRRALECLPQSELINGYGPSECTVFTCCYPIPRDLSATAQSIPIGRPIGDRRVYLLDEQLRRVPIGVRGELYVGGAAVARDYLNRPALTAEKFIPDPFARDQPGARLYKTGDMAKFLPNGNLEFLGRVDHQVKVRGFRIELGEIENVLGRHPAVGQSAVILREDTSGQKRLVAYLAARPGSQATADDLREFLATKLPHYMLPTDFVMLDSLSLNSHGKVDRRALPGLEHSPSQPARAYVAPRDETETRLVAIWEAVLGREGIGINDDFFALGGHSLSVMQLSSKVREQFQIDFALARLFHATTVAKQAEEILTIQLESLDAGSLEQLLNEFEQTPAAT